MKTMLILILLFTGFNLNAQIPPSWKNKVQTYIPYIGVSQYTERVAVFANHFGIHVLKSIHNDDNNNKKHATYFRLTSEGSRPDGFPEEGKYIDSYGDFPNIVGNENIIYAVYRKDNTIQVKYSTNGGDNWSGIEQINFVNGNVNCNGVDAAYTFEKGLHVVWSEKVGSNYESYFFRFYEQAWRDFSTITNTAPIANGGFPTVTTSFYSGLHKAHVTVNIGNGDLIPNNHGRNYSRDFNYPSWSIPIAILPQGQEIQIDRLLFTEDGNIHCFYYKYLGGPTPSYNYRKKLVTSSTWGSEKEIEASVVHENMHKIQIAKTSGNAVTDTIHAFWMDNSLGLRHRKKNSSSEEWTFPSFNLEYEGGFRDAAATSASNDLFALWSQYWPSGNVNYEFRHYDDVPLVPQNFVGSVYYTQFNSYPKLDWSFNNEPDVRVNDDGFIIYRSLNGGAFLLCTTLSGQTSSFIDFSVPNAGGGPSTARYKIKARDLNGYESDWTNIVSIAYGDVYKIGSDAVQKDIPKDFSLSQNYPNPFNPTTIIHYSIKSPGLVTLKVYDMLGTEIASLVNETKEPGNYSVTFNAANLPSGMYVYILSTGNFVDTKKLILLK